MATTTSLGPTYDPPSTAAALAQKYTEAAQSLLKSQTSQANAVQKGLLDLRSAISAFQASLGNLTGLNKALYAQSAVLSDPTLGTGTAAPTVAPGTYTFFVKQLATAHQTSYTGVPDNTPEAAAGSLDVMLGSGAGTLAFSVDLTLADTNGDNLISVREIAAAINKHPDNKSRVSASVLTVAGVPRLMLSSQFTGEESKVQLVASDIGALNGDGTILVDGQDAILKVGPEASVTEIKQGSNTFTNIDGVKLTFTKAQAPGATPLTVTVGPDNAATVKNVQDLLDAYNKLKTAVEKLVDPGDPEKGVAAGPFAHDAGIRALRDQLVSLVRPGGSSSLAAYGITGAKGGGGLVLKEAALLKKLAADPTGLDRLIGSSALSARSGIAGALDKYLTEWSSVTNGKIKDRTEANDKLQKDLAKRQDRLDAQYDSAYQRYLLQFTRLQQLQTQMNYNVSMFDALFGSDKSK